MNAASCVARSDIAPFFLVGASGCAAKISNKVSRIERGAGNPTEGTLQRLAFALDKRLELV
jgi:transcriptional regulator with XRE-family HTH domain